MLLAPLAGCQMQTDYSGTGYLCPEGECPDGFVCLAGECREGAPADAGGSGDAGGADGGGPVLLVVEAESFSENITRGSTPWITNDTAGHSGNAAMLAQGPGISAIMYPDYYTVSSQLDYRLIFPEPGIYFVWIRGVGASGSDTCIPGLDGAGWATQANPSGGLWVPVVTPAGWQWGDTDQLASERVTVAAATSGEHTFNLWLREDGVIVDKILLTTDAGYRPQGIGP